MSELIETYLHKGDGYNPFIIKEGWQVAQLNYLKEQDLMGITKMDMHLLTDEVFILLSGNAVLIAATVDAKNILSFRCVKMLAGITYNIPVKTWHNIAMDKEASVIIIEKSNTHVSDFVFRELDRKEEIDLKHLILETLNRS